MARVANLSPKLSSLKPASQELMLEPGVMEMGQRIGGISAYSNAFKRGYGDKIFGSSDEGIWLGKADFENAPFRVDMLGRLFTQSENGNIVIDTVNNRIVVFDDQGVPRILIGKQAGGF